MAKTYCDPPFYLMYSLGKLLLTILYSLFTLYVSLVLDMIPK